MFKDPVCQMSVEATKFSFVYRGKKFYFCSQGCLDKFERSPEVYSAKQKYDLIIVGGGPAGLTAGVYSSILKIDTLLLSKDIGGQAVDSSKIKNYMGFDFVKGPELLSKFKNQLIHHHYIDHKIETVTSIQKYKKSFSVRTLSGNIFKSRSLIVATGMVRNKLGVPGERRFNRKGIGYTASQDIPLLARKRVAVIGGGNSALQIVLELHKHKCKVVIISLEPFTADPILREEVMSIKGLKIYDHHAVVKIEGEERIESVLIKDISSQKKLKIEIEAIFVAIGFSPNSALVRDIVDLNKKGEIEIDPDCSTKTPGLFAAGDVTDVFAKRIIIASGEGAKAALAANKYLVKQYSLKQWR